MGMRIGYGWDSHAFKDGVPLKIGGYKIEHPQGLAGHSDGDVLLHAITDALLGAVSAGDIGTFFPPGDPRWKNADSRIFLDLALQEIHSAGYRIANVDSTLILAAPKIGPIANEIRDSVAACLKVPASSVGIKAKTPEGLNQDNVAIAHVVALLEQDEDENGLSEMGTAIDTQESVEAVVSQLVQEAHGVRAPRRRIGRPAFDTDDIT